MILEDRRLHEVKKPWVSYSYIIGVALGFFGASCVLVALFFYFFPFSSRDGPTFSSVVMMLMGIPMLGYAIYKLADRKDRWLLFLPYNTLLYELVARETPGLLKKSKFNFKRRAKFNLKDIMKSKGSGKPIGQSYRIIVGPDNYFDFEFGLTHGTAESGEPFHFQLMFSNIRMKNLRQVKNLHYVIQSFLEDIEYDKFKEVRSKRGRKDGA